MLPVQTRRLRHPAIDPIYGLPSSILSTRLLLITAFASVRCQWKLASMWLGNLGTKRWGMRVRMSPPEITRGEAQACVKMGQVG